jgi:hypothetical protein
MRFLGRVIYGLGALVSIGLFLAWTYALILDIEHVMGRIHDDPIKGILFIFFGYGLCFIPKIIGSVICYFLGGYRLKVVSVHQPDFTSWFRS